MRFLIGAWLFCLMGYILTGCTVAKAENCNNDLKFGDKVKIVGSGYSEDYPDFYLNQKGIITGKWDSSTRGKTLYNVCILLNNKCAYSSSFPLSSLKKTK